MQSDRGTQLIAAAKEVAQWDFSGIQEWRAVIKFMWDFIPTCGQAERIVDITKKIIVSSLENCPSTFNELLTIAGQAEDAEAEELHLMPGRVTTEAPQVRLEEPMITTHCIALIESAYLSLSNNWVRKVPVKYKKQGEGGFRFFEHPSNKIILVILFLDQQHDSDDSKQGDKN